jgi:tRNA threonylcarbamoyl adenosine modification protein YeaZ
MSNFICVDTSSHYLTVLCVKGDKKVKKYIENCAMKHSVMLMGVVDEALNEAGLSPNECDFFGAVTGPGSFTGIRIGISTAKGFALSCGKPLVSVTSFELIAYNVKEKDFYVVIDAAHDHFYVQGFGKCALSPSYKSREEVESLSCPLYGFENLSLANYTKLDAGECLYPAVCALDGRKSDKMDALYVRKSQAEEGRK